jgi:tRNA modification GTPase
MTALHTDPIVAIATPAGRGAVGVVRVSGRGLAPLVRALCGRDLQPRHATYLPFLDDQGQAIDQGLALYFPAPHSYTGEDVLELQAHGGTVVMQLLLARCVAAAAEQDLQTGQACLPHLRLAQPGEFTQRAFLNDKLDLAQAEAVSDLIDASTEAAARGAARSLQGAFSQEVETLLQALVRLRILVESTLDFPEEEIDFLQQADAQGQLNTLIEQVARVLSQTHQGALLREGMKVVIAGQPNAGKSSLLNALAGAELAIVTPVAGTTRDVVGQSIQIEGVPLHVLDTAGLRDTSDEVERIGIERAWREIAQADAVLFVHDLTQRDNPGYQALDRQWQAQLPAGVPVLHVWNKLDAIDTYGGLSDSADDVFLSAKRGKGLDELRRRLLSVVGWQATGEGLYSARQRHVQALRRVQSHLDRAHAHLALGNMQLDLLAEELRLAQVALSAITGAFSADDLLGEIFSRFCIGK